MNPPVIAFKPRPDKVLAGGLRLDGRGFEEFRNVFMKTGVVSQASGSAYVEFANTKVMVGVYGPRKGEKKAAFVEEGRLNVDYKVASFATRKRGKHGQGAEEREVCGLILSALAGAVRVDSFPKAVVDVYCCVLEAGGSEVAAAITAAALALADAGIEMTDLVSACALIRVEGHLLLDPTADESFHADGSLLVAYMARTNQVSQVVSVGEWRPVELRAALELCLGGCVQLDEGMRGTLETALTEAEAVAGSSAAPP